MINNFLWILEALKYDGVLCNYCRFLFYLYNCDKNSQISSDIIIINTDAHPEISSNGFSNSPNLTTVVTNIKYQAQRQNYIEK